MGRHGGAAIQICKSSRRVSSNKLTERDQEVNQLRLREKRIIARREGGLDPEEREYKCYYREPRDCMFRARNFPQMKAHLREEFETMAERKIIAAKRSEAFLAKWKETKAKRAADTAKAREQGQDQSVEECQPPVSQRSGSEEL